MAELDWFTVQRDNIVKPHPPIHYQPPKCEECGRYWRASRNQYGHIIRNEDGSPKFWNPTCTCIVL